MDYLLSLSGILSIITLVAILGGMGWFVYKMIVLSAKPGVPVQENKHSTQH